MAAFSQFLRTEFSEENIEFWLACEEYKAIDSETKLLSTAKCIYTVFIEADAPKEVQQHDRSACHRKKVTCGFPTHPTCHMCHCGLSEAHSCLLMQKKQLTIYQTKRERKKTLGESCRSPPAA